MTRLIWWKKFQNLNLLSPNIMGMLEEIASFNRLTMDRAIKEKKMKNKK